MNDQLAFLPFSAINEFMRPDFRISVIRDVVNHITTLPGEQASKFANVTRRLVKIPGFRNSEKAPPLVKVMPMVKAFEKSSELVSSVLSVWTAIHRDLCIQVYNLLQNRNWPILDSKQAISYTTLPTDILEKWPVFPFDASRDHAPGFLPRWPKGEDFNTLYSAYVELFPDSDASMDVVSLMVVWLTLRLPYNIDESDHFS